METCLLTQHRPAATRPGTRRSSQRTQLFLPDLLVLWLSGDRLFRLIRLSSSMPLVQREVREICLHRSGSDTLLFYWRHQEFLQRVGRSVWCELPTGGSHAALNASNVRMWLNMKTKTNSFRVSTNPRLSRYYFKASMWTKWIWIQREY